MSFASIVGATHAVNALNAEAGNFFAPISGVYWVSAFIRAESGDVDVSLRRNSAIIASFGEDYTQELPSRW